MKLTRRLLLAVFVVACGFILVIELPEAQRSHFGKLWGNWLLAIEATLLVAASSLVIGLRRNHGLRKAGAWLLLAGVSGFFAWFSGPDQRLSRAVDRYQDARRNADQYRYVRREGRYSWKGGDLVHIPPDYAAIDNSVLARQELTAREHELAAARLRHQNRERSGVTLDLSFCLWVTSSVASGLGIVDLVRSRPRKTGL